MSVRTKFILFVGILHAIALLLSFIILREHPLWFIVSEVLIILSLWLARQVYMGFIRPVQLLMKGASAIREKDFSLKFLSGGNPEMNQLIGVYNQMIDELKAEKVKQETQHFFLQKLVETSPTGIIILDFDEKLQMVNQRALEYLQAKEEDLVGRMVKELDHPILNRVLSVALGGSQAFTFNGNSTFRIQKSQFIDRGFSRQFVILEELTSEILMAQRAAYEKVIRMMAHEVNNTVGPVNSILDTTLQMGKNTEAVNNALRVAIERNNNLNVFMKNFAELVRVPQPEKTRINTVRLAENIINLMKARAGDKKIAFATEAIGPELEIDADLQQFEQVLINLVKNSMEAIDEKGEIKISADHAARALSVCDTGRGVTEEIQQKLFTPFFSTKKEGQGIGLALVREILSNHEFGYSLKTREDGWTEFRIVC